VNRFWSRVTATFAGLLGGTVSASSQTPPSPDHTIIGAPLADVLKSCDLFTFFQFEPTGPAKPETNGLQITPYKPQGEAFRALVTLHIQTDKQGVIHALSLYVNREFIDDPKRAIYAADLVKSFLLDAAATSQDDPVGSLSAEISSRTMKSAGSAMTVLTAHPLPEPTGPPSPAYQTYAGNSEPATVISGSGKRQIVLSNVSASGTALLMIVATAKD